MKKLFLLGSMLIGLVPASYAGGVHIGFGFNLPLPPLPRVVISAPQVYAPAPAYPAPAPVYAAPAPVYAPQVYAPPAPVCAAPVYAPAPSFYFGFGPGWYGHSHYYTGGWGHYRGAWAHGGWAHGRGWHR